MTYAGDEFYDDDVTSGPVEGPAPTSIQNRWNDAHDEDNDCTATWDPLRKAFVVVLPGNVALPAPTEWDVAEIVSRHAPGSSIRWIYPTAGDLTRSRAG